MAEKNLLEWYIQQATVKIEVGGKQGSGFFIANIPPRSYILTTYHCIGDESRDIVAKAPYCGELKLNIKTPIRGMDIVVLEVVQGLLSEYCLPLGSLPRNAKGNKVISVGYPAIDKAEEPSVFVGRISNVKEKEILLQGGVIKGEGQSGASIYHYDTNRVVGIARKISSNEEIKDERAIKIDSLFDHWPEFEEFNSKLAKKWDERIKQGEKHTTSENKIFLRESTLKENEKKPITSDEVECRVLRIIHELSSQSQDRLAKTSDILENSSLNDFDNELINQTIDKLRRNTEIEYKLPDRYRVTSKGVSRLR